MHDSISQPRVPGRYGAAPFMAAAWMAAALCLWLPLSLRAQEPSPEPSTEPPAMPLEEEYKPLPGDWAVALIDQIANSPNPESRAELMRAVMRVGPAAVPILEPALKDDRTAEFAAQALAYLGGKKALNLLWESVPDPRDLALRRFYYGALAEFDVPEARELLLHVVRNADAEPDRTVTEAAIVALTARADPAVLPQLREAMEKIDDLVIRLDLENAIEVIDRRAQLRTTGQWKATGSVEQVVRGYFSPALSLMGEETPPAAPVRRSSRSAPAKKPKAADKREEIQVHIENVVTTPDGTRALAGVRFETPDAYAHYDFVLQRQLGDWILASVWLGEQREKTLPKSAIPDPPAREIE